MKSFIKIGPVVSPNGSGQTDRHTHTQTHTHTHRHLPFFPDTITIHLVNEMTKCKKGYTEREVVLFLSSFTHKQKKV